MTGMLASVSSLDEARLLVAAQADVIDLKDPKTGSLGALPKTLVKEVVQAVKGRCLTSCTIGDLPMQPELVYSATQAMAETGVDYVKVGFFPNGDNQMVLEKLAALAARHRLIAVLFADANPGFGLIEKLSDIGFSGVMLDTLDKAKGSLCGILPLPKIESFVHMAKSRRLICGLAGSLSLEDIPSLISFKPDYLGFRGALCDQNDRRGEINSQSVIRIKQAVTRSGQP